MDKNEKLISKRIR